MRGTMGKKLLFIYNPRAGKAQIKSKLADILDVFAKAGYEMTVVPTQKHDDARRIVASRSQEYDLVVCSGGDGTLDETVTGMMQSFFRTPFGYIPAGSTNETAVRVEFFGDEIDRISEFEVVTGNTRSVIVHTMIFPASHYIIGREKMEEALAELEFEMDERIKFFKDSNKLIEAQRIEQRTRYDMEMLREIGTCKGVENYSRVLARRPPGSTPITLIDHFPEDFLLMVDERPGTLPPVS